MKLTILFLLISISCFSQKEVKKATEYKVGARTAEGDTVRKIEVEEKPRQDTANTINAINYVVRDIRSLMRKSTVLSDEEYAFFLHCIDLYMEEKAKQFYQKIIDKKQK